jgi:hypothetical protein
MFLVFIVSLASGLSRTQLRPTEKTPTRFNYGVLAGNVTNSVNGNPVSGLTIVVARREIHLDNAGRYTVNGLPQGNYTVVLKGGATYGQQRRRVTIHAAETTTLDFKVTPRTAPPPRQR